MFNLLKNILPESLKTAIWKRVIKTIRPKLVAQENRMPKLVLQDIHVKNTKLFNNRLMMLEDMPKNGIVAEIGVDKGDFSEEILKRTQPQKLHLIDVWDSKRYHLGKKLHVETKFEEEINKGQLAINFGYSTDVVSQFEDNYFDWIYIDTEHSYSLTKRELELYAPKVKPGGIISGHDYINGIWINMVRYGVIEAVSEFCVNNNWELIYLTTDFTEPPSFAIRRI